MKVTVIYHPKSEHARSVEEFVHDYGHDLGKQSKLLSLETREGAELAKLYDVVNYPAILVIKDDSQLIKLWEGMPLPLIDEVAGYDQ
ncbi:hypothetical protein HY218_01700 [Candidatus Saccharibacteria bacterium]|nr:hypothetical protein [Candidatus Saccharibacteria bacterium]